jgi:hypothetical protein
VTWRAFLPLPALPPPAGDPGAGSATSEMDQLGFSIFTTTGVPLPPLALASLPHHDGAIAQTAPDLVFLPFPPQELESARIQPSPPPSATHQEGKALIAGKTNTTARRLATNVEHMPQGRGREQKKNSSPRRSSTAELTLIYLFTPASQGPSRSLATVGD